MSTTTLEDRTLSPEVREARDRVLVKALERVEAQLGSSDPEVAREAANRVVRALLSGARHWPGKTAVNGTLRPAEQEVSS
jgi:hypothetical protein